ncbi:MAG: RNA polymerase sigma factor [Desulfomonilaceae bacterium]|nr:RNA polymerase sigma factor [Desulfomonilaceae bacterium]
MAGSMAPLTDEELIGMLAEGDENALRILVERYSASIYRFSVRYTGDESLAEDVAQEVFFRLFLHAKKFTSGRSFRTWLFTIVRNVGIDLARPYSHRKSFSVRLGKDSVGEDFAPESIANGSPTQEERMTAQERQRMVIEMLQDLPEKQRAAIVLKYYEDMSTKEIAEVLGKSVSSVEALLARGKRNLAKSLKL